MECIAQKAESRLQAMIIGLLLAILVSPSAAGAGKRDFVRELTYQASDDDSKNSARAKALTELRKQLLSEVGVYMESYIELKTVSNDSGTQEFVREEIKAVTAGITESEVIDEQWDGEQIFIRARMKLDPDEVVERVREAAEDRSASTQLDALRRQFQQQTAVLASKSAEIGLLEGRLATQQRNVQVREAEVAKLSAELAAAESRLAQVDRRKREVSVALNEVFLRIDRDTVQARAAFRRGLTYREISRLLPNARRSGWCFPGGSKGGQEFHRLYGRVWIAFDNSNKAGIALRLYDLDDEEPTKMRC